MAPPESYKRRAGGASTVTSHTRTTVVLGNMGTKKRENSVQRELNIMLAPWELGCGLLASLQ